MLFSVITVVYNAVDTIEKTINSVLSQENANIEYIIIDGGSTDGTVDIIRKYEKRLKYWVSEPDKGIYDAMNKGLYHATGNIVSFINSGDVYLEKAFSKVAGYFFDNPQIDILCGEVYISNAGTLKRRTRRKFDDVNQLRTGQMLFCHQGIFSRRDRFEGGFDVTYSISSDYEWLLRNYYQKARIVYASDFLAIFANDGVSYKNRIELIRQARKIAHDKNQEAFEKNCISRDEYDDIEEKITFNMKNAIIDACDSSHVCIDDEIIKEYMNKSVAIFGTGDFGTKCIILLRKCGVEPKMAFDNDIKKVGSFCHDVPIKGLEYLKKADVIFITSMFFSEDIYSQLIDLGISKEKVCFSTLLFDMVGLTFDVE